MSKPKPYSVEDIRTRHLTEPVFIVSGCVEPAHGSPALFDELGLSYDKSPGYDADYENWGNYYPLTADETKYVAEDCASGIFGGAMLNYALLYKGKKWITPIVEVCWTEGSRFSEGSYGGTAVKTEAEATRQANWLASKLRPKVEELGGQVLVRLGLEQDRHGVLLMFPPEVVQRLAPDFDHWQAFVGKLIE